MPVDTFDRETFEAVLPDGWYGLGLQAGEYAYRLPLDNGRVEIEIRSSIGADGVSAGAGEDSIRAYLLTRGGRPVGTKVTRWTTRTSGWEKRLRGVLDTLAGWRAYAGDCRTCKRPKGIFLSKTPKNPNRPFTKCVACDDGFDWLDEPRLTAYFAPCVAEPDAAPVAAPLSPAPSPVTGTTGGLSFLKTTPVERMEPVVEPDPPPPASPSPSRGGGESKGGIVLSGYQEAIFDFVKNGSGHAMVEAVAGAGKTFSLVRALSYTPASASVAFVAFNRHIANELASRAPAHVHVSTLHSLGYRNVRHAFGQVKVDERKVYHILQDMADRSPRLAPVIDDQGATIHQLVGLAKGTLIEPTPEALDDLCDHYAIDVDGSVETVYDLTARVMAQSAKLTGTVDFNDMVWFCATGKVPCEGFDFLFFDELQDGNRAQLEMVARSTRHGGRVTAVGDRFQAIMGFAGSDTESVDRYVRLFNATRLPLSITYRCPLSHVSLAQTLVPQIEPRPGAPEGTLADLSTAEMLQRAQSGDMVICRTNAPLVAPAFELIRRGVKATIRGRDIGKGMIALLHRIQKRLKGEGQLTPVLVELDRFAEREVAKLQARGKNAQAVALQDQRDTLAALGEGCDTVAVLEAKINAVFDDTVAGVVFSSIHRAKGLEAERVFLLRPSLIPHPMAAKRDWQLQQEYHLQYIAWTRSKDELYFVEH